MATLPFVADDMRAGESLMMFNLAVRGLDAAVARFEATLKGAGSDIDARVAVGTDADTDCDGIDDGDEDSDGDGVENQDDDSAGNCDHQGQDDSVAATHIVIHYA